MKHLNLVYCKHHPEDNRAFLYELPASVQVSAGDRLCVEDRRGEHIVTAFCDNWYSLDSFAEILCTANGGYYPPAKVIGKVGTKEFTVTQDYIEKFDGGEKQWIL